MKKLHNIEKKNYNYAVKFEQDVYIFHKGHMIFFTKKLFLESNLISF